MDKDIVAYLPDEVFTLIDENNQLPDNIEFVPGSYCLIGEERVFIHTRATLPLHSFDKGIGLGLWVEIPIQDFNRYAEATEKDELYKNFKIEGTLANQWPAFENIFGIKVEVRTIRLDEKVHITQVFDEKTRDPLFSMALNIQHDNNEKITQLKALITAWLKDYANGNYG